MLDPGQETEAYAAYLNSQHRAEAHYEPEQLAEFHEDLGKARAGMERAWLESQPVLKED